MTAAAAAPDCRRAQPTVHTMAAPTNMTNARNRGRIISKKMTRRLSSDSGCGARGRSLNYDLGAPGGVSTNQGHTFIVFTLPLLFFTIVIFMTDSLCVLPSARNL
jgi:hypothetical protein